MIMRKGKNMIENNYNGFISKDTNEISLYDQFKLFLKIDNQKAKRIKKNCFDSFEKYYSIKVCYNNYINYYKSISK